MSNLGPHEERKQIESDVFDGMNLIYITRLALKIGKIRVAVLESVDDDGTAHCILKDGKQAEYKKGEWSSSLEDAEKGTCLGIFYVVVSLPSLFHMPGYVAHRKIPLSSSM